MPSQPCRFTKAKLGTKSAVCNKKINYALYAAANDGEKLAALLEKAHDAAWKHLNEYFNKCVVKCFPLASTKM